MLVGFLLTTVAGSYINHRYQRASSERQQRFEQLKRTLDKQELLLDSLSELVAARHYWLTKVYLVLRDHDPPERVEEVWGEYFPKVTDWNLQLRVNWTKLHRLADEETAARFFTVEDDQEFDPPETVHGQFRYAHVAVLDLRHCVEQPPCENEEYLRNEAWRRIMSLDVEIGRFLVDLDSAFKTHVEEEYGA